MGGTSTDVSLCPGRPLRTREFEIAGQPTSIPVIDIHTVGAGGGSLARLDTGGALRVGPQSAGAQPGPICYGRGGTGVTVTDAHVWLGRLPADAFLGGDEVLNREAIRASLEKMAAQLGTDVDDAAEGVLAVADTAMEGALRVISVERGYDPADFAVVAFGGAGGLHVAELTRRLGALKAIVPPDPGLLSAYGMLASPVSRETARTVLLSTEDDDTRSSVDATLAELEGQARFEMLDEAVSASDLTAELWVDARYTGQSFEIRVPATDWIQQFHTAHEERYGHRRETAPVEAVTLRAIVTAPPPPLQVTRIPGAKGPVQGIPTRVAFAGDRIEASRVWRHELAPGHEFVGPFVVQEYSGTTWVPPGWRVEVDPWGCLHLTSP
jgi:N-methylhydantoinase A